METHAMKGQERLQMGMFGHVHVSAHVHVTSNGLWYLFGNEESSCSGNSDLKFSSVEGSGKEILQLSRQEMIQAWVKLFNNEKQKETEALWHGNN